MSASISFSGSSSDKKVRVNAIDPPKELNISGSGVTVTDNPGAGRYDIVISAGGGGGTGEANTMSNSGVDGLSIVLAKSGVNLPVKGFNVGSSKLSITDDITDHTIDYDVVESNLTLSNMGGTLGYSKLVLTNSIVNTDVSTSAAIAYSKLALGTSIVNSDIATAAAISHSKIGTNLLLSETGLTAVRTVTFPDSNGLVVYSADSRMTNARTPTVHASTHQSGGSDSIALDTLAATTDITTLNASTSAHGLLKKLSGTATQYLDGTGAWSTPAGGGGGFTEAKGSSTQSGTASATAFTIAHTLGGTPTWVSVIPKSTDADDDFAVTADATNITITYPFPPPNITSNLSWWWRAAL